MSNSSIRPMVGLVREATVLAHVEVGRTKWRELVARGEAPQPHKLSERICLYSADAIHEWIAKHQGAGEKAAT